MDFNDENPSTVHDLKLSLQSTHFVVYDGYIYYYKVCVLLFALNRKNKLKITAFNREKKNNHKQSCFTFPDKQDLTNTVARYSIKLRSRKTESPLPEGGQLSSVRMSVDEKGLWMSSYHSAKGLVIYKLDAKSLEIEVRGFV